MKQVICWCLLLVTGVLPMAYAQVASTGSGQVWPTRPVRIVTGFSAGSATDISARLIAPKLADIWGKPVVIETRTGAGSSIASAMTAQATPDGYTILLISAAFAINAVLRANAGYDPLRDFASVAQIGYSTGVLVVTPTLGVKSIKELIALANERPGKILYGSAGAGSGIHRSRRRSGRRRRWQHHGCGRGLWCRHRSQRHRRSRGLRRRCGW